MFKKNLLAAAVLTGSVLGTIGTAIPAFNETAHAQTVKPSSAASADQKKAENVLMKLYKSAHTGKMPVLVHNFKINITTRAEVYKKIGKPEIPASKKNHFDTYTATMGQGGYAFSYHANGKIAEIRYFGTNVERQQNLGGITNKTLAKRLGRADRILTISKTKEKDYIYKTGGYEIHFVVGKDHTVSHVNLKASK
ncbi:YjgB family protein [Peribacillus sp. B-H-3]|uniref:YjgB family protein n=1 Tax=Peribacillus sp. B-H-3 TaxID=3400420 RepID=UPI003B01695F